MVIGVKSIMSNSLPFFCSFLNSQLRLGTVFGVEQSDLIEVKHLTADNLRLAGDVKGQYVPVAHK